MFNQQDFLVFDDLTLAGRMDKIRSIIDPKFEAFADLALPILKEDGQDWYAHVAKHKMRKTNAPDNTWVAFAPNKRGYKMMPHFELGLWADNLYLYLAVEENMKPKDLTEMMPKLRAAADQVTQLPSEYCLSLNHMVNENQELASYANAVDRYEKVKAAEVLVGLKIPADSPLMGQEKLTETLIQALKTLLPIYEKLR
ncbi:DUF1054 family protein [Fructobacillus evanidus]|uniref:UPF0637 family (YktB) n=1 Tax=Fructobacillus evanidus TaxID=3064281 RepID=A0ABM9MQ05_9LACO|nr:UPF0637 family (YktB) [Fructobacillus sp. LMG 32999]CAK1231957.1 UPF0637 family (YktB) [Fructobacillus sp. LMG 32999]CAK1232624.1 UPF0637 family (YktB) [Fructobacillus sp. LMG 32999]CAK1235976.1 UPF0637 family (YktB) [Fructobacillus sp. LMG 32999]CAK1238525.1 UPF0637 family (YktB) [Fructobacillus sp. LMG 32999]